MLFKCKRISSSTQGSLFKYGAIVKTRGCKSAADKVLCAFQHVFGVLVIKHAYRWAAGVQSRTNGLYYCCTVTTPGVSKATPAILKLTGGRVRSCAPELQPFANLYGGRVKERVPSHRTLLTEDLQTVCAVFWSVFVVIDRGFVCAWQKPLTAAFDKTPGTPGVSEVVTCSKIQSRKHKGLTSVKALSNAALKGQFWSLLIKKQIFIISPHSFRITKSFTVTFYITERKLIVVKTKI